MPFYGSIVIIKRSGANGSVYPLVNQQCFLGRSDVCDIRIQLPLVSEEHCRIEINDVGEARLVCLSENVGQTQLNGKNVKTGSSEMLYHKAVFTVGDRSFRWEYPQDSVHVLRKPQETPKSAKKSPKPKVLTPNNSQVKGTATPRYNAVNTVDDFVKAIPKLDSITKSSHEAKSVASKAIEAAIKGVIPSPKQLKTPKQPVIEHVSSSKRVSFGPYVSPEIIDKTLPPSTPVKRGAEPLNLSLDSNSSKTMNSPKIIAGNATPRTVDTPSALIKRNLKKKISKHPENLQKIMENKVELCSIFSQGIITSTPNLSTQGKRLASPIESTKKRQRLSIPEARLKPTSHKQEKANTPKGATPSKAPGSAKVNRKPMWSEIVKKAGQKKATVPTKANQAQRVLKRVKKTSKVKTPLQQAIHRKGSSISTGHAASPETFTLGQPRITITGPSPLSTTKHKEITTTPKLRRTQLLKIKTPKMKSNSTKFKEDMVNTETPQLTLPNTPKSMTFYDSANDTTAFYKTAFDFSNINTPEIPIENFVSPLASARIRIRRSSMTRMSARRICKENSPKTLSPLELARTPDMRGIKEKMLPPKNLETPNMVGIREMMSSPKHQKSPNMVGIKEMLASPRHQKSPNMVGLKEMMASPKNQITPNMIGIKEMMRTPKTQKSPRMGGLKQMLKTPEDKKTPDMEGIKKMMKSPRIEKTPNMIGIKEMMLTPKYMKSPRLGGIKQMLQTPKNQKTPDMRGIKKMMKSPRIEKTPNMIGIKEMMLTPKYMKSPRLGGMKQMLQTPKNQKTPDMRGIKKMMTTPKLQKTPSMEGIQEMFASPRKIQTPIEVIGSPKISKVSKLPEKRARLKEKNILPNDIPQSISPPKRMTRRRAATQHVSAISEAKMVDETTVTAGIKMLADNKSVEENTDKSLQTLGDVPIETKGPSSTPLTVEMNTVQLTKRCSKRGINKNIINESRSENCLVQNEIDIHSQDRKFDELLPKRVSKRKAAEMSTPNQSMITTNFKISKRQNMSSTPVNKENISLVGNSGIYLDTEAPSLTSISMEKSVVQHTKRNVRKAANAAAPNKVSKHDRVDINAEEEKIDKPLPKRVSKRKATEMSATNISITQTSIDINAEEEKIYKPLPKRVSKRKATEMSATNLSITETSIDKPLKRKEMTNIKENRTDTRQAKNSFTKSPERSIPTRSSRRNVAVTSEDKDGSIIIEKRSPKKTPKSKKPAKKVPTPSPPKRITRSRK